MKVNFVLNGRNISYEIAPGEYLADTLRANHILSVKKACDEAACGACTVLLDGRPILSCSFLSARVEGRSVTTVEAVQDEVSEISDFFSDEGADQCGFCNTGLALTIIALRSELKNPTDEEIKHFVVGNLCRCTGYQAQFKAIKRYLEAHK
ncbi:MAG: 2Fe-2S iron-sulfur cluster-binding protein [Bacilli bacterium]|jgi:carbon-monoxide dehydrogenase small subunit|nr:2Fe-2S iron-sulfur cluster-binding protein [Bacilli bacterium]HNY74483.1 2Fe-2S iron-sulfur cluster-binding protein [Bacilli bacterium]HPY38391.1 2Fe-2S iron-sulfur cluster-binding protein [Bacilli bacterium]HQC32688.1 2Fe-2S iron-sulfur cluster-binding protein [Bacilli bacterium]